MGQMKLRLCSTPLYAERLFFLSLLPRLQVLGCIHSSLPTASVNQMTEYEAAGETCDGYGLNRTGISTSPFSH